uniref:Retrotransposon gag domain-containing protein n=1 Tax=Nelumbo nucifera TaxID=4432 RepID=A0A822YJG5_NELNU|nr:TPA_asm: hypothetical protein HUJ06_011483 [Nelumbo nucifera]
MHRNQQLSSWTHLTSAIEEMFGPSSFVNHQATLIKLQQTSSVTDYQSQFETICNRIDGLPLKPSSTVSFLASNLTSNAN